MMFVPWIRNDQSPITISFLTSRPNARLTSPPEGTLSSFLQKLEKIHLPCHQRQLVPLRDNWPTTIFCLHIQALHFSVLTSQSLWIHPLLSPLLIPCHLFLDSCNQYLLINLSAFASVLSSPITWTVSKSVFPKHQWRFQNNPNKQFQRTFLSSGSTVGKGAWLLRQILGERPHTYPDVYEIVPQSVWYFTATSQVVRDADLHFLIHTRGASYSSSVYRGRFQPQGGWTYFSKSTGFVQVFSSTCLLWFCH